MKSEVNEWQILEAEMKSITSLENELRDIKEPLDQMDYVLNHRQEKIDFSWHSVLDYSTEARRYDAQLAQIAYQLAQRAGIRIEQPPRFHETRESNDLIIEWYEKTTEICNNAILDALVNNIDEGFKAADSVIEGELVDTEVDPAPAITASNVIVISHKEF